MKKVWKWKVECQHNSVNVKVLEKKVDGGVRTGVEMVPRDYRGAQWKKKLGVLTYCCKWEVIW